MADSEKIQDIIIKPQEGFQEEFARSTVDVVFGGGAVAAGKSYALCLAVAEPLMTDPEFRCLICRRALSNLKAGGGFVEKFKQIFGSDLIKVKESDNPRISFPNGTFCDLTYIDESNLDKLRERAKGWEYDVIAVDEITEMSWDVFSYIMTRNRGQSKTFSGKMFATLNPKRSHWTRQFLDWYIGIDGLIIPERNGFVRYFFVNGQSVKDVVWGNSKEEVYRKCRISIDRKLAALGKGFSYENLIKSFVFYQGKLSENKGLIGDRPDYAGSVAASGGLMSQALLEGNFNVDTDEVKNMPISSVKAQEVFTNDPAINGDKWITVDLADYGTDNLVGLAWNGFHIYGILILSHTTPSENAARIRLFAQENDVAESHIIFDGTAGRYFNDYIPDAIPFLSSAKATGLYCNSGANIKDICYLRLVKMITRGQLTIAEDVAQSTYSHQNLKYRITVENEFLEECSVVNFYEGINGKKRLYSKKQMNARLGHSRSMDLLDPCAMRMLPCVNIEYGSELQEGFDKELREMEYYNEDVTQSIYDETIWC